MYALLALILFYRGHFKVVRTISSDHEAVFKSCSLFLEGHGANSRARIPGEHDLNDLAKRSPIDPAHFFEFKSTLAYGPSDSKIEERKVEEQIVERIQMPIPQPAPEPIIPAIVAPASPGPVAAAPTQVDFPAEEQQVRFAPTAVMPPASSMPRRRMKFGSPLPAIITAA